MARDKDLATLLAEFDEPAALETVHRQLAAGQDPIALVAECTRGMRMINHDFSPHFSANNMYKDLSTALTLAEECGVPLPVAWWQTTQFLA